MLLKIVKLLLMVLYLIVNPDTKLISLINNIMYIYVLDYCQSSIFEIKLDKEDEDNDDIERILHDYGLSADSCEYMYSENKLNIEVLTKN